MTRRALFGLALAGGAAFLASCSRAVRSQGQPAPPAASSTTTPSVPQAAPPATSPGSPTSATPAASPTGPAVEVGRGPASRAEVALTFHGAGDPALARELLALLATRQVTGDGDGGRHLALSQPGHGLGRTGRRARTRQPHLEPPHPHRPPRKLRSARRSNAAATCW